MKTAVSSIASSLSTRSWKDLKLQINPFIYYTDTQTNAKIRYQTKQVHLWIHSDASYLNEFKAHSRNGFFLHLLKTKTTNHTK